MKRLKMSWELSLGPQLEMSPGEKTEYLAGLMADSAIDEDWDFIKLIAMRDDFELTKEHYEEHRRLNYQNYYEAYLKKFS